MRSTESTTDLHHLELLGVREVTSSGVVVEYLLAYVDVRPVHQPLLHVLQHLPTQRVKPGQMVS